MFNDQTPLDQMLEDDDEPTPTTPRAKRQPSAARRRLHDTLPDDWLFVPSFGADDIKGRGITISVKLPEDLADAASSLIGRTGVPFATLKHMAREGVHLVVMLTQQRLAEGDPHVAEFIMAERLSRSQRQMLTRVEQLYVTVATLRDTLVDLLNAGALGEALDLVYVRRQEVKAHPDSSWRGRYQRAIDKLPIVQMLDRIENPEEPDD